MTVFPTYNEYVQAGGKLPGFLYEKARKKWHKKWDVPYEASATEQDTEASAEYEGGWCEEADASMCELDWGSDEYELSSDEDGAKDLEASMIENLETSTVTQDIFSAVTKGHPELPAMRESMTMDETNTPRLNGYVTFLIDGGANTPIFQSPAILATAKTKGSKHKSISTAKGGDSLQLEGEATVTLYVKGTKGQHEINMRKSRSRATAHQRRDATSSSKSSSRRWEQRTASGEMHAANEPGGHHVRERRKMAGADVQRLAIRLRSPY